jgi:predicted transcriptional regulator of viral defense system
MKVSQKIEKKIKGIQAGITFCYQDLSIQPVEYNAAAKTLERLIKKGIIKRISTGVFYVPKQTMFGEIKPQEEELLKSYLFDNGKRIAYITGLSLYNRLGFTTQIPKTIKIASRDKRIYAAIGNIKGKPIKSYIDVTENNYYLLEILDVLKDFKQIPDLDKKSGIKLLTERMKKFEDNEISLLIKYALKYPPRTRAFLGSILERIGTGIDLKVLKKSLNPFTQYEFNISEDILPNSINWNIK